MKFWRNVTVLISNSTKTPVPEDFVDIVFKYVFYIAGGTAPHVCLECFLDP